nr:ribonuclease H-like domain, reverse transcriptase, RNA-dependent DNA polymerase [Tanacetum cinerariifolium]
MAILEDLEQMKEVEDQKVSLHEEDVGYKETSKESLWYLDNSASNHMTGVREHFKELDEKVSGKVKLGDDSYIEIRGKALEDITPYEAIKKRKPNLENLKVFECIAYAKVPLQHLTKLDDRSTKMVYLGNEQGSKAYRLFDPTTRKICVSRDVKFKEDETWDWSEYLNEHFNDEPEWMDFKIGNLEETNEHHDQENQPNEEDNDFPNNNDDGYNSPLTDSPSHSQTPHTPSTSYGVNIQEGKGTTGIIFYYGDSPISWSTQKQATIALSSCESEFIAATAASTQALWLKRLLSRLTHSEEKKITIMVDNKSAIQLIKNPVFHGRSKHIDIKYHFIRECVERDDIQVEFDLTYHGLLQYYDDGRGDLDSDIVQVLSDSDSDNDDDDDDNEIASRRWQKLSRIFQKLIWKKMVLIHQK